MGDVPNAVKAKAKTGRWSVTVTAFGNIRVATVRAATGDAAEKMVLEAIGFSVESSPYAIDELPRAT